MDFTVGGEIDLKSVGNRLKQIRKNNKWTQQKMAEIIGYTPTYYNAIENGKAPNFSHRSLMKVSQILNVDSVWLAYGVKNEYLPDILISNGKDEVLIQYENNYSYNSTIIANYFEKLSKLIRQKPNLYESESKAVLATIMTLLPKLNQIDLQSLIEFAETQKLITNN